MSRMHSLKFSLVGGISELKSQAKIVNQVQKKKKKAEHWHLYSSRGCTIEQEVGIHEKRIDNLRKHEDLVHSTSYFLFKSKHIFRNLSILLVPFLSLPLQAHFLSLKYYSLAIRLSLITFNVFGRS